jgi:NDP-sugar pyrophosphorylase family protein
MTYGDGLIDVNIRDPVEFHKSHGKIATVTTVPPISRFGLIDIMITTASALSMKTQNRRLDERRVLRAESRGLRLPRR